MHMGMNEKVFITEINSTIEGLCEDMFGQHKSIVKPIVNVHQNVAGHEYGKNL